MRVCIQVSQESFLFLFLHKNLVKHSSPASKKALSVSQGQNNFLTAYTSTEFIQSASETVIMLCLLHYTSSPPEISTSCDYFLWISAFVNYSTMTVYHLVGAMMSLSMVHYMCKVIMPCDHVTTCLKPHHGFHFLRIKIRRFNMSH